MVTGGNLTVVDTLVGVGGNTVLFIVREIFGTAAVVILGILTLALDTIGLRAIVGNVTLLSGITGRVVTGGLGLDFGDKGLGLELLNRELMVLVRAEGCLILGLVGGLDNALLIGIVMLVLVVGGIGTGLNVTDLVGLDGKGESKSVSKSS